MSETGEGVNAGPDIPGPLRLLWLLFLRPLTLHRMLRSWGLEGDPNLWSLRRRWDEPQVRLWGRNAAGAFACGLTAWLIAVALFSVVVDVRWLDVAWGVVGGVVVGVAWGVAVGVAGGVAWGVAVGVAGGVAWGLVVGAADGVTAGVAWGVAVGVAWGVASGVALGVALGAAAGVVAGVFAGVVGGVVVGVDHGLHGGVGHGVGHGVGFGTAFGAAICLSFIRAPIFLVEAPLCSWIALARSDARLLATRARLLPVLHDELVSLPLPYLEDILTTLANDDPALAETAISAALESPGQERAAWHATRRIQTNLLIDLWRHPTRLETHAAFLPPLADLWPGDPLRAFLEAHADLWALEQTGHGSQHRRRKQLEYARRRLQGARSQIVTSKVRDLALLLPAFDPWIAHLDERTAALEAERQDIPNAFQIGNPLQPRHADDLSLFRGRGDLAQLIDQDIASPQRAPLLLCGQRRMGKSSLLAMLPRLLGASTEVCLVNFQKLSGEEDREHPERFLARTLAKSRSVDRPPPSTGRWGATLTWLAQIDDALSADDHKLLIAVDEVENVQAGINDGWTNGEFLDFVRAAGDHLSNIRLLLVSAYPLERLGPLWTDRLISAVQRPLGPLAPAESESLLRHPIDEFPDIWPDDLLANALGWCAGHPYLLQYIGKDVVDSLNERELRRVDRAAVDRALERCLNNAPVFPEVWSKRDPAEQAFLRRLAGPDAATAQAPRAVSEDEFPALRSLAREGFVTTAEDGARIAVPLFARWIRVQHAVQAG